MYRPRLLAFTVRSWSVALAASAAPLLATQTSLAQAPASSAAPSGSVAPSSAANRPPVAPPRATPPPTAPSTGTPGSGSPPAGGRLDSDGPGNDDPGGGPPGSSPPPYMYQEPWTPPSGDQLPPPPQAGPRPGAAPYGTGPYPPGAYPPPYTFAPPPYAPLRHRTPWNALWIGGRAGAIFPYGNVWDVASEGFRFGESWRGLATAGLSLEGDVGVRLARHYILYGFWEHGWLGTGSDPSWRTPVTEGGQNFGEQMRATTDFAGAGFRWSSNPDRVGVVLDVALGQRWFRERWMSDAGRVKMDLDGFGELRIGIGAEIRVNPWFALSPLLSVSTGTFSNREITLPGEATTPIQSVEGSHGTVTLTLGGHFDLGS